MRTSMNGDVDHFTFTYKKSITTPFTGTVPEIKHCLP